MSIYDNETKIYPDLNPTAPQEAQSYQLNKLSEIDAFLELAYSFPLQLQSHENLLKPSP